MDQRKRFAVAWVFVTFLLVGCLFAFTGLVYAFGPDTDLSNADASFWGEDADDWSGYSVASAGDVNGDGYDDFLIGAYGDDDGGILAGQTYLILGRAAADWGMDFDLSNADASFRGEDSYDRAGYSVASAGDVNGDGRDDFLIGAYGNGDGGSFAGQTYLILGRAAADWGMDFDLSNADASFWGEDDQDLSGWSVASAGDVNGDGRDDFLIGAYGDEDGSADGWQPFAGQTYLILGRAAADWGMDFDLSGADASFWGEDTGDYSGFSVASAGDVNGDGRDDFLIGAYLDEDGGSSAGQTYLVLGRAAADWGMDFDLSSADASFWGEDAGDYSGRSVASAGDVNADGYDDFLIGAWGDDDGGADAGQTYLIWGRAAADWGMDFDLSGADASFWGEDADDYSGFSVASAGDVNGDGRDDFLIGAYGDDDGGSSAGQSYLLLGDGPCVETSTGTGIACFSPSAGAIEDLIAVATPSGAPVQFPHGMFSFKVTGLSTGQTVTLGITLPVSVPAGTKWYKYDGGAWDPMDIGSDDGDNFITVALQDGAFPDDEDAVPGQITDQGGPGNPGAVGWEAYPTNRLAVVAPWIALAAAIITAALIVIRRWRVQSRTL